MEISPDEIQQLVDRALEKRAADLPPRDVPKRVQIFNEKTGEPPPTPDGYVWQADVYEWCDAERPVQAGASGRFVRNRSEVLFEKPKKRGRPPKKQAPPAAVDNQTTKGKTP